MKSEWKNITIGDCCNIEKQSIMPISGNTFVCYSLPAFDNSKKPEILDGKDIKSSKFVLTENTILFNKLNPKFRRVWNIHSLMEQENTICSTEFLPLKTSIGVEQDFLYYYVSSPSFTDLMDGLKTGTSNSQQRIDWKRFLQEKILLPPLEEQKKIASVLRALDDKIATNTKINDNLAA